MALYPAMEPNCDIYVAISIDLHACHFAVLIRSKKIGS